MNQAAGTSRGAESRRARPNTCPGSPGKVGEAWAPPGVPDWLREVPGRGWGGPVLLLCTGPGAGSWGRDFAGGHGQEVAAPAQKGSGSRSSQPRHGCPVGDRSVPAGDGRERRGGREDVLAQVGIVAGEGTDPSVLR